MCDKMAISAYILKTVEKDPFLRIRATVSLFHKFNVTDSRR